MSGTVTVVREVALLDKLPASIKLSDEQRAKVNQLVDAHATATRADRDALNSIATRAMNAINAGRPREEVVKILDEAKPIQQRLAAADAELIKGLTAILTAEQNAWLQSQLPQQCDRSKFPPLTAAQQKQIAALDSAFAVNNRADIEAVKAALVKAGDAKNAGKSEAEVNAILEAAKPALDRLAAATKILQDQIAAIYTPEQKSSGCVFLG
jgi:Spy/CpxP family protein refolding chaperone